MKFKVGDRVKTSCVDSEILPNVVCELHMGDSHGYSKNQLHAWDNKGNHCVHQECWKKVSASEESMRKIKYGVKYDRDTDPVEFFKSKPQAKKRIQELLDDPEVKKESIYLFQVGKVEKVQRLQNFELVKV